MTQSSAPSHFKGQDAVTHVIQAQADGIMASTEIHGAEIPGPISAAADAARETSIALILLWILLTHLHIETSVQVNALIIFGLGWTIWKIGRSSWFGWSRLERLHRVLEEERWEIQHHRAQEREELTALYQAKGFEGKLLDDVMDVLMADEDRLLKIMIEEELGLSLEAYEHPLKQGIGAGLGSLMASCFIIGSIFLFPLWGALISAMITIGLSAFLSSYYEKNRPVSAIVWNIGIGALAIGSTYFLIDYFIS